MSRDMNRKEKFALVALVIIVCLVILASFYVSNTDSNSYVRKKLKVRDVHVAFDGSIIVNFENYLSAGVDTGDFDKNIECYRRLEPTIGLRADVFVTSDGDIKEFEIQTWRNGTIKDLHVENSFFWQNSRLIIYFQYGRTLELVGSSAMTQIDYDYLHDKIGRDNVSIRYTISSKDCNCRMNEFHG